MCVCYENVVQLCESWFCFNSHCVSFFVTRCRIQGIPLSPLESPSQSGPASTPTAQKKCVRDVTRADPKRNNKDDKSEAIDSNNIEPQYRNMDVKTNEETVGTPTPDAKFVTL